MNTTAFASASHDASGAVSATAGPSIEDRMECMSSILHRTNSLFYRCSADDAPGMLVMEGAVSHLTGRDAPHFLGSNRGAWTDCIHPEDAARVSAAIDAAIKARSVWGVEYRLRRPGKDPVWVTETGGGVFGQDGTLRYLEGHVVDATARRTATASSQDRDMEIRDRTAAMTKEIQPVLELLKTLKILAINARVEAARAGDAGRGFTIVAREVGELATKSDSRARAIADLTKELSALLGDEKR